MNVGEVRKAEEKDFQILKSHLACSDEEWTLEYEKKDIKVWTQLPPKEQNTNFKLIKVKTTFSDVSTETLFDVLMDSKYRVHWDKYMKETHELGHIDQNNNISYYAISCPPAKKRDFVVQSSWLQSPLESIIINHSVFHKNTPPVKGYIRATSYFTGFCITPNTSGTGCNVGYVTHSNPKGRLPSWVINKLSASIAPKFVKWLHKASIAYPAWKKKNDADMKWWIYPEQISSPKINVEEDCLQEESGSSSSNEESLMEEEDLKEDSLNGDTFDE